MDKQTYYSEFHKRVTVGTGPAMGRERFVVDYLRRNVPHVTNLMDIGCLNSGLPAHICAAVKVDNYFGMDLLPATDAGLDGKGIKYTQWDLDAAIPSLDVRYDVMVCSEVIEHLVNPDNVFLFARQSLTPGGVLIVTTPNLGAWFNRILLIFGYQPCFSEVSARYNVGKFGASVEKELARPVQEVGGHLRMFTLRALVQLGQCYGLRLLEKKSTPGGAGIVGALTTIMSVFPSMGNNLFCVFGRPASAPTSR
jgi:SAM-dependent methyltransferase